MILTELKIENFRMFGEGEDAFIMPVRPGLTALIGENDSGKTAVIDALRLALGTRDQEFLRVSESDFHQKGSLRASEIRIRCKFEHLTKDNCRDFLEYLTYETKNEETIPVLYLNWKATDRTSRGGRQRIAYDVRSGSAQDGIPIDMERRELLFATYLWPLRDAERALASGRRSRLSQILLNIDEIQNLGIDYEPELAPEKQSQLSILGIGSLADDLLRNHKAIKNVLKRLNEDYLDRLFFIDAPLTGHISVSSKGTEDDHRLRQLLEKFELELGDKSAAGIPPNAGLGSNNLLFIACELLLAGPNGEGLSLLLIEEPEAHLHPQRQLRLMQFLQNQADARSGDGHGIQIIVTTHSPNLASVINLDNMVLLHHRQAYSLAYGNTGLTQSDYRFLQRFLDVTKANLFFARGVMIVEGDSENILLPTLAALLDRNFTNYGVSIVNVGGRGLRRYARIFLRDRPGEEKKAIGADDNTAFKHRDNSLKELKIPVACVADLDVMPDCAPKILGKVECGGKELWPKNRRWKVESDFNSDGLEELRKGIRDKAHAQHVKTFVSDKWTFEYDLAYSGLAKEVWIAAQLAKADDRLNRGSVKYECIYDCAINSFEELKDSDLNKEQIATKIYASFVTGTKVSKPITCQYLAQNLHEKDKRQQMTPEDWEKILPPYLVNAIKYVTGGQNHLPGKKEGAGTHE